MFTVILVGRKELELEIYIYSHMYRLPSSFANGESMVVVQRKYRVRSVPSLLQSAVPVLTDFHLPKQNRAGGVTYK